MKISYSSWRIKNIFFLFFYFSFILSLFFIYLLFLIIFNHFIRLILFTESFNFQVAVDNDATPPLLQDQFWPFCVPHTARESRKSRVWVQILWYSRPSTRNFRRKIQPSMDIWLLWLHSQSARWKHWKNMNMYASSLLDTLTFPIHSTGTKIKY